MKIHKYHGTLVYSLMKSEKDFAQRYNQKYANIEDWFKAFGEPREYPIMLIEDLQVDACLRNKGNGTRLLKELEDIANAEGVTLIYLKVGFAASKDWREIKAKNIHFYKKSGYRMITPSDIHEPYAFKLLQK